VVEKVLAELGLADRPTIPVFNKLDAVADPAALTARVQPLYPGAVMATTMRIDGLEGLKARLRAVERKDRVVVRVRVPASDGARAAALYRMGEVMSREDNGRTSELTVRLDLWQAERLRDEGVEVSRVAPGDEPRRRTG